MHKGACWGRDADCEKGDEVVDGAVDEESPRGNDEACGLKGKGGEGRGAAVRFHMDEGGGGGGGGGGGVDTVEPRVFRRGETNLRERTGERNA